MRFLRLTHRWLGLLLGIQLLLWSVSGLAFAWLDHHRVAAEHSIRKLPPASMAGGTRLAEPETWLADYPETQLKGIRLLQLVDRPVYRVELDTHIELRDAVSGSRVRIDEATVRRLAAAHYAGGAALLRIREHPQGTVEARDEAAVWQAEFDDAEGTSLYFSAADGRLIAARNDTWRAFDFFWMLHTMDYEGRDNFNNPLVILVSTGALWLAISGVLLLFRSFRWLPA